MLRWLSSNAVGALIERPCWYFQFRSAIRPVRRGRCPHRPAVGTLILLQAISNARCGAKTPSVTAFGRASSLREGAKGAAARGRVLNERPYGVGRDASGIRGRLGVARPTQNLKSEKYLPYAKSQQALSILRPEFAVR